jgi:hypothetical protein
MPIVVDLIQPQQVPVFAAVTGLTPALTGQVVRPDITQVDGCPVLQKLKVFAVEQGTSKILEWVMRDGAGNPINLTGVSGAPESVAELGQPDTGAHAAVIRVRTALATGNFCRPGETVFELDGAIIDPLNGIVRCPIDRTLTGAAAIYEMSWGIKNSNGDFIFVNQAYLSIDRSLFGADLTQVGGSPTLQEVRLSIRDSLPENLWLSDLEFDAAEVIQCMVRPIAYWNEVPPPLQPILPDQFPYREHWLKGIQGYLMQLGAHHYRRVHLKYAAGGTTIDDKNREMEYMRAAQMLLGEYREWVKDKKYEINVRQVYSSMGSAYQRGWW